MMKKLLFPIAILLAALTTSAQTMSDKTLEERISELENKAALKNLVDIFSNLADVKDVQAQTLLFTENATIDTYRNGLAVNYLEGRKQIGDTFGAFLSNFKTVYHFNGQHAVAITGNKATGTLYCLTVLISPDNVKTTFGIHYNDEYVYENGRWLISKRTSYFDWQDIQRIGQ